MGRVEKRVYKRRRKRRMKWLLLLSAALLISVALLLLKGPSFTGDTLHQPTATPMLSNHDRTVETREVTMQQDAWYAIQTGVYSTVEAANERAGDFADRGAPGCVVQSGDKWRVFIACYGSEEDASAVRTRLSDRRQVDAYLYTWNCPEVRLRLTGQRGQLDAVEAGFMLMPSAAAALRDAAMQLDAGELTAQEAAQKAEALNQQMQLWRSTVKERFGSRTPDLVQGMLTLAKGFADRVQAIEDAGDGPTERSAALKTQAMGFYDDIVRWRTALLAK